MGPARGKEKFEYDLVEEDFREERVERVYEVRVNWIVLDRKYRKKKIHGMNIILPKKKKEYNGEKDAG